MLNKKRNFRSITDKLFMFSLLLLVFSFPLYKKAILYLVSFFILSWLLNGKFKPQLNLGRFGWAYILILSFFLMHIVGLAYSSDIKAGLFDIEVKLTLLIFPFAIATKIDTINKNYYTILHSFILGNLAASLFCLANALDYYLTLNVNYFYYSNLSVFHHPSYFAMYLAFAIMAILVLLKEARIRPMLQWLYIFLIPFFLFFIYLLSSKAGIIIGFSLILYMILSYYFQIKKVVLFLILILTISGLSFFVFKYNERFKAIEQTDFSNVQSGESIAGRYHIWKASLSLIKQNFVLGVGTGDAKNELLQTYQSKGMTGALEKKLNSHNQFFETYIAIGFIGFLILSFTFLSSVFKSIIQRKPLLLFFTLLVLLNFMVESMLNTQAGVIFFAFFYSFLNFAEKKRKNKYII